MAAEVIEGQAYALDHEASSLPMVHQQPGQAIVAAASESGPVDMLGRASVIATALATMVDKQRLYTVIKGKKFPNVEAWQTIGRMDNVVAREATRPVRNADGSWEAEVELVRLSDGMVIGNGSALCGAERDGDWTKRPDHEKRSMAVTRATSRAFRQQYAWIMALAGYEVTPADEMPRDEPAQPRDLTEPLIGIARAGKDAKAFELQQEPNGVLLTFRLEGERGGGFKVEAHDEMALVVKGWREGIEGQRVSCWGRIEDREWTPRGKTKPVVFQVLTLSRIKGADFDFPASGSLAGGSDQEPVRPPEAPGQEAFDLDAVDRETELAEALAS